MRMKLTKRAIDALVPGAGDSLLGTIALPDSAFA